MELRELHQLAYAGLLEAIDRFDLNRGVPFYGFAGHRIMGSIRDGIAQMSELREQATWRAKFQRERMRSLVSGAQNESQAPIQKLSELAVGLAVGYMLEGEGAHSIEVESVQAAPTAYESAVWTETITHLKVELDRFPDREQTVLRLHYLSGCNFDTIAVLLRVTKGRISQIHRSALKLLQSRLRERGHFRLER